MIAFAVLALFAAGIDEDAAQLDGYTLMQRFQCGRCHERGPMDVEPTDRHCVSCHRRVGPADGGLGELGELGGLGGLGGLSNPFGRQPPRIPGNVTHLRELPSLDVAGRLRSSWIEAFLQRPHDLRRGMGETMPRLPISPAEARAIAKHLTRETEPAGVPRPGGAPGLVPGDAAPRAAADVVTRGLELLEAKGCGTCHAFTGAPRLLVARALPPGLDVDGVQLVRGMSLAPDLRFTRDRTTRAHVKNILESTAEKRADQHDMRVMPLIPMTSSEIDDVVAALFDAKLTAPRITLPPARLPPLDRKVTFEEVRARVLNKTCIHCHADDSLSLGVGGPGNSGGFGYAGTGLVLTGYARLLAGSPRPVGGDATRKSVFRPVQGGVLDGVPLLVAQLRARQIEEAGGIVDGVVGMPLGLPAVTQEELQLVDTWVAQGRPQ